MNYFDTYASNTLAGSSNQYFFTSDKSVRKGRVFYKIFDNGEYNYYIKENLNFDKEKILAYYESALDLGIILAAASSFKNIEISKDIAIIGEVGLTGEIRSVNMAIIVVSMP